MLSQPVEAQILLVQVSPSEKGGIFYTKVTSCHGWVFSYTKKVKYTTQVACVGIWGSGVSEMCSASIVSRHLQISCSFTQGRWASTIKSLVSPNVSERMSLVITSLCLSFIYNY